KIDRSLEEALEQLVNGKEIVVGFHARGEFKVDVDVALRLGLAFGERAEPANPPHAEGAQLCGMSFHHFPGIYIAGHEGSVLPLDSLLAPVHPLPPEAALDAQVAVGDVVVEGGGDLDDLLVLDVDGEGAADAAVGADGVGGGL